MLQCGILLGACEIARVADIAGPPTPKPQGDWPRLVDAPFAPGPDETDPSAPDPAEGARIAERLRTEAAVGAARAETIAGPVVPEAEAARLRRAAEAPRE